MVPLRRMLGTDSIVIRVKPDGSLEPMHQLPALFFERSIRHVMTQVADGVDHGFEASCVRAVETRRRVSFRPPGERVSEILINPILDDSDDTCRFLVCWTRHAAVLEGIGEPVRWSDLRLDAVVTRYRRISLDRRVVVEAAPWWALPNGELLELWPHHGHVAALGLGHAVMQTLINDTAGAAVSHDGGPAVRLSVPSADMLAGLVPVFHAALRVSGLDPARIVVGIGVELAVDPDLLPLLVHLRTMGLRIDIVGLAGLTRTLHSVSDTARALPAPDVAEAAECGPWMASFAEAFSDIAV